MLTPLAPARDEEHAHAGTRSASAPLPDPSKGSTGGAILLVLSSGATKRSGGRSATGRLVA